MDVKENHTRVLLFVALCVVVSLVVMWAMGVPVKEGAGVMLGTSLLITIGVAYGMGITMHDYRSKVNNALKSIDDAGK